MIALLKRAERALRQLRTEVSQQEGFRRSTVVKNALIVESELTAALKVRAKVGGDFGAALQPNEVTKAIPVIIVINTGNPEQDSGVTKPAGSIARILEHMDLLDASKRVDCCGGDIRDKGRCFLGHNKQGSSKNQAKQAKGKKAKKEVGA